MPIRYVIARQDRRFSVVFWGVVTTRDLLGALGRLYAESDFNPEFDGLIDLRALRSFPTEDEIESVARQLSARLGLLGRARARRALVADTPLALRVARMYEIILRDADLELEITPTIGDALSWLARRLTSDDRKSH